MYKSDYQKVCDFNLAFDFPQYDDFLNEKILKLRIDLIKEEITELKDAYSKDDTIEILDACADILYVAYGMAYTYKINSDDFLNYLIIDQNDTLFRNIVNNISTFIDIENTIKMIDIQYNKLENCCKINHMKEASKALHDIIIYVYDLQKQLGYDSDKIFDLVHESNMTKLCKTEQIAKDTVEKYENDFKSGKSPYDSPFYYQLTSGAYSGYYIVKNKSSGKALKSINYTAVQLNLIDYVLV